MKKTSKPRRGPIPLLKKGGPHKDKHRKSRQQVRESLKKRPESFPLPMSLMVSGNGSCVGTEAVTVMRP